MHKKRKKPLVLVADRVTSLTQQDLTNVEGGWNIPPKLHPRQCPDGDT